MQPDASLSSVLTQVDLMKGLLSCLEYPQLLHQVILSEQTLANPLLSSSGHANRGCILLYLSKVIAVSDPCQKTKQQRFRLQQDHAELETALFVKQNPYLSMGRAFGSVNAALSDFLPKLSICKFL